MSNADQIEYWNGKAGERWRDDARALDQLLAPFLDAVLQALPQDLTGRVLDVGCGGGSLSLAALTRFSGVSATGVDVSKPLLSLANERAAGLGGVEFIEADASTYSSAETFDAGVRDLYRTAEPDGTFSYTFFKGVGHRAAAT